MTDAYTKMIQQMMESGQDMLRAYNPALDGTKPDAMGKMFPTLSKDMMEMWFGKTCNREGLDARTRLLLTIGALTVLGAQADAQMKAAVRHALKAGATEREITETIWQMSMFGGLPAMQTALEIAQSVFADTREKDA